MAAVPELWVETEYRAGLEISWANKHGGGEEKEKRILSCSDEMGIHVLCIAGFKQTGSSSDRPDQRSRNGGALYGHLENPTTPLLLFLFFLHNHHHPLATAKAIVCL